MFVIASERIPANEASANTFDLNRTLENLCFTAIFHEDILPFGVEYSFVKACFFLQRMRESPNIPNQCKR
jgi:hypothetical protein